MTLTERAALVLQQIDADLALAEKATAGPWVVIEGTRGGKEVKGPSGVWDMCVDCCESDAAFIAASRTGWPASLRCLRTAIEGLIRAGSGGASHAAQCKARTENGIDRYKCNCWLSKQLTTLCDQWEASRK